MESILQKLDTVNKTYLVLGIFAVLVLVFYGTTLQNGFVYDDKQQIQENIYIQSLSYLPKVVTGCIWESAFGACKDRALYYRPIHSLSYLLAYQISSAPWIFHFVNVLYFFIVVVLIFILARMLTSNNLFGFIAAFLFLIHPINSEVVNWIAGVPDLTFAIFVLLSTIFYIRYWKSAEAQTDTPQKSAQLKMLLFTYLFYFLALLSKESAILLPGLLLLLNWTVFKRKITHFFEWQFLRVYLGFIPIVALYLGMRMMVLGGIFQQGLTPYTTFSLSERIYSLFALFGQYAGKLLYPYPLLFFYHFEKKSDFLNPEFFLGLVGVLLYIAALFFFWRKAKKLLVFFLLWIFIFLLPFLIFLNSLGESVFAERYLFVPNIGFALALGYGITYLWQRSGGVAQTILAVGLIVTALLSFIVILQRNAEFRQNEVLYTKTLAQNPEAYPIRFNWAIFLQQEKGDFEAAKQEFETILQQNPNWSDAGMVYIHLGDYYRDIVKDTQKALEYYEKSRVSSGTIWKAHFAYDRIGGILAAQEQYLGAIPYFCQAVQIYPEAEGSQGRLNTAISLIPVQYEDKPLELYEETKEVFVRSEHERIRFTRMFCEGETCSYIFSVQFEEPEIILSSLIGALTEQGEVAEIQGSAFNPPTSEAMVRIGSSFESISLSFIFPTCEGVYYEAVSAIES